ncbi:MAG: hypothetical protein WDN25_13000 [Acetobacteraceae bacterium]
MKAASRRRPDIGTAWNCDYIDGIGRRGDSFVVIFDLSRLLSGDDNRPAPRRRSARQSARARGGIICA